jgi:catechol 2,3-dioxygenase-like lactoylglutathione lyase family enzyme
MPGQAGPAVGPILSVTVSVPDLDVAVDAYARWLSLVPVARGRLDPDVAAAWGAPAAAGRRWAILDPSAGGPGGIRLLETDAVPPEPLAMAGWAAVELAVIDVPALASRLEGGPFRMLGPPHPLGSNPDILAMQVAGPGGEALYLTDLRAYSGAFRLAKARTAVDRAFIAVLAAPDLEAARAVYEARFGAVRVTDRPVAVPVLNAAMGLPGSTEHRISTLQIAGECAVEIDQFPSGRPARPVGRSGLAGGVVAVTFAIPGPGAGTARGPDEPPYDGRPFAVLTGAAGERIELVATGEGA